MSIVQDVQRRLSAIRAGSSFQTTSGGLLGGLGGGKLGIGTGKVLQNLGSGANLTNIGLTNLGSQVATFRSKIKTRTGGILPSPSSTSSQLVNKQVVIPGTGMQKGASPTYAVKLG